jgi:tetratricopeptide (TPR) repeat protein
MYPEAIEDANLALSVERCDNMALEVLGNCFLALGDKTKAEKYYSDIINCNPTEAKSYVPRGKYNLNQKEYTKAISDFSKSIELNGSDLSVRYLRAVAFISTKDNDNAITDLSRIADQGGDSDIYFLLSKCYLEKKVFEKALQNAKKAKDMILNAKSFGSDSFKNLGDINKIIDECELKVKPA